MKGTVITYRFAEDAPAKEAIKRVLKLVRERYPDCKETLPVEKITHGDPDGFGELRSKKEYALRVVIP